MSTLAAEPETPHSTLYLRGFEFQWEKRPHRIRTLGFGAVAHGPGPTPSGELWTAVRGGTWADGVAASDTPYGTVHYGGLASERPLHVGTTSFEATGDTEKAASGVVKVSVPSDVHSGAVWIRGFRIQTGPDHPVGYTVHGFGVSLGEPVWVDDHLEFDVNAHIQAAGVPDRIQHLKTYGATFEIDWVVVPAAAERRKSHMASSMQHKRQIGGGKAGDRMPVTRVPLSWEVNAPAVVGGLSGFAVEVVKDGPVDGRYTRVLRVQLADDAHDPVLSRWTGEADLRFANAGPVTRSLSVEVSARITTLALEEGDRSWAGRWTPESAMDARQDYAR